jgi:hypothetical protein
MFTSESLDRHITGNYGEDQYEEEPPFDEEADRILVEWAKEECRVMFGRE